LHPTVYINTTLKELYLYKNYSDIYREHHQKDREKRKHSMELYIVWNSKSYFLYQTSNVLNPFNSTYFMWVDIGIWRDRDHAIHSKILQSPSWPNIDRVQYTFDQCKLSDPKECIVLSMIRNFDNKKCTVFRNHIEGGFILGTIQSLKFWWMEFMKVHDLFIEYGVFVGRDQTLMNLIVLQQMQTSKILLLISTSDECGIHKWSQFQLFYSGSKAAASLQTKCDQITGPPQHLGNIKGSHLSWKQPANFGKYRNCHNVLPWKR